MGENITALLLISVSAAIVSMMSPEGEMKKYINLIASLAVLAAIAIPIAKTVAELPDKISDAENIEDMSQSMPYTNVIEIAKKNIEDNISEQTEAHFGLKKGSVSTKVTLDASDTSAIDILSIEVYVPKGCNVRTVKNYISELFRNTSSVSVLEVNDEQ